MKIDRISLFQVPISFGDKSYHSAGAAPQESIDGTIVRIDTDAGVTGWGEISPWGRTYLPEFAEGARAGLATIAPHLIGEDPTNIAAVNRKMDAILNGHPYIKSAVDIACWDLSGKVAGLPIYKLLGGRGTKKIPMNCAIYNGPFGEMAERISQYRDTAGYQIFSTKPSGNVENDIKLYTDLARIRRPGEVFIADANRLWSVTDAIKAAAAIEHLSFNLEQPCQTYEACMRVRRTTRAVMALDESITDGDVLYRAAKDNAADIIHLKLSRIGGISVAAKFSSFCQIAGLSLSWASSGGTEIADMAALQVAAATPHEHLFGLWSCREFNLSFYAEGAPNIAGGTIEPTEAPGLGITPSDNSFGAAFQVFT